MSKKLIAASLVISLIYISGCAGEKVSKTSGGEWMSFNEGMEKAGREKKPVIIDFYTAWCKWCKVMDRQTFSDPEVKKYLDENFVTIRIDAENKKEQLLYKGDKFTPASLTIYFKVRGYPSLAYLDSEGELVTVIAGFKQANEFLPTLKYMKNECYKKKVKLAEYIKNGGDCD